MYVLFVGSAPNIVLSVDRHLDILTSDAAVNRMTEGESFVARSEEI